jgi:hypothetical protein
LFFPVSKQDIKRRPELFEKGLGKQPAKKSQKEQPLPNITTFSTTLTSASTKKCRRLQHATDDFEHYKNIMLKMLTPSS